MCLQKGTQRGRPSLEQATGLWKQQVMTPRRKAFHTISLARGSIPEANFSTLLPWGPYDVRAMRFENLWNVFVENQKHTAHPVIGRAGKGDLLDDLFPWLHHKVSEADQLRSPIPITWVSLQTSHGFFIYKTRGLNYKYLRAFSALSFQELDFFFCRNS